jgi:hypothetical protein
MNFAMPSRLVYYERFTEYNSTQYTKDHTMQQRKTMGWLFTSGNIVAIDHINSAKKDGIAVACASTCTKMVLIWSTGHNLAFWKYMYRCSKCTLKLSILVKRNANTTQTRPLL